mmetsp:Transcript_4897/g.13257  ORF Transcript_4897/g.13257 Transcript_4897/m.13257 type:complete len:149 (-) Transcript_4897:1433-1879(-)
MARPINTPVSQSGRGRGRVARRSHTTESRQYGRYTLAAAKVPRARPSVSLDELEPSGERRLRRAGRSLGSVVVSMEAEEGDQGNGAKLVWEEDGGRGFVSGRGSAVSALQMPPHHLAAAHTPERRDTSGQMCPVIPETDQPSAVHSHS